MKKNTLLRTLASLATGTLVLALTGFSVSTYACDACKAAKSEVSASSNEQSADGDTCKGKADCKCKAGEPNVTGTCNKD